MAWCSRRSSIAAVRTVSPAKAWSQLPKVPEALCEAFPDEPVALYAGGAAPFEQRGQQRWTAALEQITKRIQDGGYASSF